MTTNELTTFQQQAAAMALHKLLNGTTFYVSDLRKIAEIIGKQLGGKDVLALDALHCVAWGDMPDDLRRATREKVLEVLGLPPQIIEHAEPKRAEEPPAKRLRLAFWRQG